MISVYDAADVLANEVVIELVRLGNVHVKQTGSFLVALSGGSLLDLLALHEDALLAADLAHWHVFMVDERCVPVDNPDSNVAQLRSKLARFCAGTNVYAIEYGDDGERVAACYAERITSVLSRLHKDTFDLVVLGIGVDGHTASLFPPLAETPLDSRWYVVVRDAPKPPPVRVTLTMRRINEGKSVWVVGVGGAKANVVRRARDGDTSIPVGLVKAEARWWLDCEAAGKL